MLFANRRGKHEEDDSVPIAICLVRLSTICLAAAAFLVQAAPSTSASAGDDDPDLSQRGAGARPAGELPGSAEPLSGSKTIQMLIELQGSRPPLETGDGATRRGDKADGGARRSAAAPPAAQDGQPVAGTPAAAAPAPAGVPAMANPFLRAIEHARPAATREVAPNNAEWKDAPYRAVGGAAGSEGRTAGANAPDTSARSDSAPRLLLPTALIGWVRENRGMVLVTSLAVLAMVGFSAARVGQKRTERR